MRHVVQLPTSSPRDAAKVAAGRHLPAACHLLLGMVTLALGMSSAAAQTPPAAATDKPYSLSLTQDANVVRAEAQASLTLTIRPQAPWVLKTTTPFEVTLSAPPKLSLVKDKLTAKDFKDAAAPDKALSVAFVAHAPGAQRVEAALNFFLCTDQVCQRYKDRVDLELNVKAPAGP